MLEDEPQKAIYMGIPVKLYFTETDAIGVGPMGAILCFLFELGLPFNGEFFVYEGNYFRALWHWLMDEDEEED